MGEGNELRWAYSLLRALTRAPNTRTGVHQQWMHAAQVSDPRDSPLSEYGVGYGLGFHSGKNKDAGLNPPLSVQVINEYTLWAQSFGNSIC